MKTYNNFQNSKLLRIGTPRKYTGNPFTHCLPEIYSVEYIKEIYLPLHCNCDGRKKYNLLFLWEMLEEIP